jgi:hypothetical protein
VADTLLAESDIEEGDSEPDDSERLAKVHERALRRFDSVATPQAPDRAQSLEARRFVTIAGAMWEGPFGEQFENSPRPEVDKITSSLEKIETDYRQNRMTVDFVPANDASDEDTADMLDGLHRADSEHFNCEQGRDNGFQEGIRGGFGAWRVTTDWADPDDEDSEEQRVNPALPIVDADQSVYFGPSKVYDKRDAPWAFVICADPVEEYTAKWDDAVTDWPLGGFKYHYDWFAPQVVRTAEYYEVEKVPDRRVTLTNPLTEERYHFFATDTDATSIADMEAQGWKKTTRAAKRQRVHKYIMSGACILKDCGYIAGPNIPIVPYYGRRDYVDNQERWRGHVLKRMDRQRIYNSAISQIVETNSLAPFEKPVFDPSQITPAMAEQWARANIDRLPFLTAKALRNEDGSIASAGPIYKIEPTQVQPGAAALLQIMGGDLTDDDQNVEEVKANVSADAMDIAADRVDAKSGIYLDNMRKSVKREAEIYLGMAREVYYEPGRKVNTLTVDGQDAQATLHEPSIDENGVFRIRNDLSRGSYKVVASVQESTTTKRQKLVRQNMTLAEVAGKLGDQDLGRIALLKAVMNQDGDQDMQKYARNQLITLGVVQPTPEEKQQLEQAAASQGQQQPSAAEQALGAQAAKDQSTAQLNDAKSIETMASATLKHAQATVLGGPAAEPDTPTGLDHVQTAADVADKFAGADLKHAQADHLRHGIGLKGAETVHNIALKTAQHGLAERAQDHAEKQPKAA